MGPSKEVGSENSQAGFGIIGGFRRRHDPVPFDRDRYPDLIRSFTPLDTLLKIAEERAERWQLPVYILHTKKRDGWKMVMEQPQSGLYYRCIPLFNAPEKTKF